MHHIYIEQENKIKKMVYTEMFAVCFDTVNDKKVHTSKTQSMMLIVFLTNNDDWNLTHNHLFGKKSLF